MRNAFITSLCEAATKDKNIFFVTADLGYSVIEDFQRQFPKQFLNVGIAEQNMAGIGAGLAASGKKVFIYSIGNFSTLRCLEQIRNDICYHNFSVTVVSVGAGFHYGALASTHHATEDLSVMRALPNMTVIAPNDPIEASLAMREIFNHTGPCYLRLCKERVLHSSPPLFALGKAIEVRSGTQLTLCAIGGMLKTALDVADLLEQHGVSVQVFSVHTLKPFDEDAIAEAAEKTQHVATIEEHTVCGGLGSVVAETLLKMQVPVRRFASFGIPDTFAKKYGSRDFLRAQYGLAPDAIASSLCAWYGLL